MQRRGPVAGNYGVAKELFGILIEQASAEGWVNGSHRVKARASAGQVVPALQALLTRTTPGGNFPGRQLHSLAGPQRRCVLPPGRRVSSCKGPTGCGGVSHPPAEAICRVKKSRPEKTSFQLCPKSALRIMQWTPFISSTT